MNQVFSYYFCLIIEESGSDPYLVQIDPDPGGPKTYGSGSATLLISLFYRTLCYILVTEIYAAHKCRLWCAGTGRAGGGSSIWTKSSERRV
jgi:hypothetical protein